MRAAYVQVQVSDNRLVLRDALAGFSLACLERKPEDLRQVAVAIVELSTGRDVSSQLPAWLRDANVPCIALSFNSSEELVISALRHGFRDYLRAPIGASDIAAALTRLLPPFGDADAQALPAVVGNSPSMRALREQVLQVAPTRTNILITGETGTGKELIAESIHAASPRRSHPFVAVNCGAIPDGLIESELFGHERGAFTGAHQARPGRVRQSDGGTLFLDEVSELDLRAQVKLLRVLETREVQSLGAERVRALDIRVVAASNQNLADRVRQKAFREDLFYRLNVVQMEVPALRARSEDIPALIVRFCDRYCREFGRRSAAYSGGDLDLLQQYDWPGNVRELRNVVEASFVYSSTRPDGLLEIPPVLLRVLQKERALDERQRIVEALFVTHWNVSHAAQRLSCSRMTLYRKMLHYQLRRPRASSAAIPDAVTSDARL
jgi:DNA-binding NtrC family response regulator